MPAKSLDSYRETLCALLDEFSPKEILEWGCGISTQIMAGYKTVQKIKSVENIFYFFNDMEKMNIQNLELVFEPDMEAYVKTGMNEKFDFVFVDGRNRNECLSTSKNISDLILVHDAKREVYRDSINSFAYQTWTDEGNTVVLTDSEEVYKRLVKCLQGKLCDEPKPEFVKVVNEAELQGVVL